MSEVVDVVVIGAGAAGLMCAATAGYRGREVLVLDHAGRPGRKILMSGGGRCNFTNLNSSPANFISANPAFCISALSRYTPRDFLELVERHGVAWCEKESGQLFCRDSARDVLDVLLEECGYAGARLRLRSPVTGVARHEGGFRVSLEAGEIRCRSLVIATGGLSIPTMGASPFGYGIARRFGLPVVPVRAGLVPFTLQPADRARLAPLSGISAEVRVTCRGAAFRGPLLVTHRGLSGPAMLQISSYREPGDSLEVNWLPEVENPAGMLRAVRRRTPNRTLEAVLGEFLPQRLAAALCEGHDWSGPLQGFGNARLEEVAHRLSAWQLKPAGTEGYRTAEVTLGGVDTRALSQKTLECRDVPGLFFIGEVVDVTGHLGGHNFQWAWASGHAAGEAA